MFHSREGMEVLHEMLSAFKRSLATFQTDEELCVHLHDPEAFIEGDPL